MVTLIKYGALSGGEKYNVNQMWIDGLSTDSKPTTTVEGMPIPNGSVYTEVDTGKTYMFDKENVVWYEVSLGGGGVKPEGGIILVGETTTPLTDGATTNPIVVDGQSYTAQPNDAVIYGNKEFLYTGTKWIEFGDLSGLSSKDIGAMTGYTKATTGSAITTTDTLNQAIGKVEKRVDINENNILSIDTALGKYLSPSYQMQTYEYGGIDGYGGLTTADNRIRTSTFLNVSGLKSVSANDNQLFLVAWTADQSYGSNSPNTPGGWNGETFGHSTGQWINSIDIAAIVAAYPTYKFGLVVRYADNSTITDINALLSTITFTTDMSVERAIDTLFADGKSTVELPFEMPNIANIYKQGDTYTAIPTSQYITKTNGVTVFVSPTGSDVADGLTVNTPLATIDAALTVSNVANIILLAGTYVAGTNYTAGVEISTSVNIIGIGDVIIDNINGQNNPINIKKSAYIKGIHFKHGNNTVKATLTASDTVVFEDCIFSDSDNTLWSNGLAILGGNSILINCCAYNNAYDGFNYHANSSVLNYTYEINCKSYNNGSAELSTSNGQSSNATTTHDGSHIIRVNGDYYACHGGIVADLQAYSANYGCKSGISTITDSTNYADRMSNYWCSGGTMYLYGCDSYGSKYDTARVSNGQIISDKVYPSNYGTNQ